MPVYKITDFSSAMQRVSDHIEATIIPVLVMFAVLYLPILDYHSKEVSLYDSSGVLDSGALARLEPYPIHIVASFWLVYVILCIRVYRANFLYVIDTQNDMLILPATNLPRSLWAYLLFVPELKLYNRECIKLSQIEGVYIDTQRYRTKHRQATGTTVAGKTRYRTITKNHVRFNLSIVGTFGSQNLMFMQRQKRDEVRNAILQAMKQQGKQNVKFDTEIS